MNRMILTQTFLRYIDLLLTITYDLESIFYVVCTSVVFPKCGCLKRYVAFGYMRACRRSSKEFTINYTKDNKHTHCILNNCDVFKKVCRNFGRGTET